MSHHQLASCALCVGLLALGCGSNGEPASSDRPAATPQTSGASAGRALFGRDVLPRCAGFGATHAAELLGVPASAVVDKSQDITPTSRGCSFAHGEDGSKALLFSVNFEESVDDAKTSFAQMRDTLAIGGRVQESATGKKFEEGAYSDILGLGEEAVWSPVNNTLAVRQKNITVQVISPDDKKIQQAIALKVVEGLR